MFALLPTCLLANPIMTPGAWNMSMKMTAINPNTGKKVNVGNSQSTFCLTQEFLATDPYLSPTIDEEKMRRKGANCTTSGYSRSGNSAGWTMSCTMANGAQVESNINTSVTAKSYTVTMKQTAGKGKTTVKSTIATKSKYMGNCTSSMPSL